MQTVYIETTIPSLYFDDRPDPSTVARREWTRSWWDGERQKYRLLTGVPVIEELSRSEHPRKTEKLQLLNEVQLLLVDSTLTEIIEVYETRSCNR